ncbi:MAG: hypothetical protein JXQ73_29540 [Phycisphaerae bacterium]|nr:hypothetical protein [Phycisphaerae bacterium]
MVKAELSAGAASFGMSELRAVAGRAFRQQRKRVRIPAARECLWPGRTLVCAVVLLLVQSTGRADWYDCFDDGVIHEQNPCFDLDDPNWIESRVSLSTVELRAWQGRLRVTAASFLSDFTLASAAVQEDADGCWFTCDHAHYILANVRTHDDAWGARAGRAEVATHALFVNERRGYGLCWRADDGRLLLTSYNGVRHVTMASVEVASPEYPPSLLAQDDANRPTDPRIARWMLLQYDPNGPSYDPNAPTDANDPNCHWLRGAAWSGEKHGWSGEWVFEVNCVGALLGNQVIDDGWGTSTPFDANLHMDTFCHAGGWNGVSAASCWDGTDPNVPRNVVDVSFDDFECRRGRFTSDSRTLSLEVVKPDYGRVTIDPDLRDDPNDDPNEIAPLRRYTPGTAVRLVALPVEGRGFDAWRIWDPNHPNDVNHVVEDGNSTLELIMDADWRVEAVFRCGEGSVIPFVGIALAMLGVAAIVRRRL